VDDVKTEYSRDSVPLAPELVTKLLKHRAGSYPTDSGSLFANPRTAKPYHQEEIQKKHIRPAAKAAGIKGTIGWKTFRHSYRSWLDQTEAPVGIQQELMRHASIQTTMNVYGRAMTDSKRQAHDKVVQMIRKNGNPEPIAKGLKWSWGMRLVTRKPFRILVAGGGFEPPTFGL
jgi:integrase